MSLNTSASSIAVWLAPRCEIARWSQAEHPASAAVVCLAAVRAGQHCTLFFNIERLPSMRIAQIAPLTEAVPPKLYGGTERVISWLTEALVDLGHDVTLFASGDSVTNAKLEAGWPRALRLDGEVRDANALHMAMLETRQLCVRPSPKTAAATSSTQPPARRVGLRRGLTAGPGQRCWLPPGRGVSSHRGRRRSCRVLQTRRLPRNGS